MLSCLRFHRGCVYRSSHKIINSSTTITHTTLSANENWRLTLGREIEKERRVRERERVEKGGEGTPPSLLPNCMDLPLLFRCFLYVLKENKPILSGLIAHCIEIKKKDKYTNSFC